MRSLMQMTTFTIKRSTTYTIKKINWDSGDSLLRRRIKPLFCEIKAILWVLKDLDCFLLLNTP